MRLPIIALATAAGFNRAGVNIRADSVRRSNDWLKQRESADAPNDQQVTLYQKSKALVIFIDAYDGRQNRTVTPSSQRRSFYSTASVNWQNRLQHREQLCEVASGFKECERDY
jgi:hypothetical protein